MDFGSNLDKSWKHIFKTQAYRDWNSGFKDDWSLLWIKGNPGAGKSTVMSHFARQEDASHSPLSYFFISQRPRSIKNLLLRTAAEMSGSKCLKVLGALNGVAVNAFPDTGSPFDAVSLSFAEQHEWDIEATETQSIPLPGGNAANVVGRVIGDFRFHDDDRIHRREFKVLEKSVCDLILGRPFLDETKTFTQFRHRIVESVRPYTQHGNRLFLLDESPTQQLRCHVNGATASAFADTGSDLMLVSGDFARQNGFNVHRSSEYKRHVELIDGSVIQTNGMVLDAELQFDVPPPSANEFDQDKYLNYLSDLSSLADSPTAKRTTNFVCDLHVVEDLPCDVILSNDFILRNDVFSGFKDLFFSGSASASTRETILASGLLFMRDIGRGLAWPFRRWSQRQEANTAQASMPSLRAEELLTPIPPPEVSWNERWEREEARRDRAQKRIAGLPEPQRSSEQRSEDCRQRFWVRNNPDSIPVAVPTSSQAGLPRRPVPAPTESHPTRAAGRSNNTSPLVGSYRPP